MRFLSSLKGWLFWLDIVCFFAVLCLGSALLGSQLPTYIFTTNKIQVHMYKNDSYYQKMYTICLSKYCAILLSYCLDGAFLLDFIDSTWILKTSWTMDHAMNLLDILLLDPVLLFYSYQSCSRWSSRICPIVMIRRAQTELPNLPKHKTTQHSNFNLLFIK